MRYLRYLSVPSSIAASLTALAIPAVASADYVVSTWTDNSVHVLDEGLNNVSSFPTGADLPNGIATDGTLIYTGHFTTTQVFAYDFTGAVQFSWVSPSLTGCQGLELVGDELAVANVNGIDFLNPADGTLIRNIPAMAGGEGLGYDGTLLWQIVDDNLYGVDPDDGAVISTIPNAATGCSFDGTGISPDGDGNLTLVCTEGTWFIVSAADGSTIATGDNNLDMYGSDFFSTGPDVEVCDGVPLDISSLTPGSDATVTQLGTTTGAVNDYVEDSVVACWGGSDAAEHVYSFSIADDAWFQIDLDGSAYDTKLGVVSGCPAGDVWCQYNDDFAGVDSGFPCTQYPAGSYSLIVSGFSGQTGAYTLNITECSPCGDGVVDPGEECDDELESAMCDLDCTFATGGDGTTNMTAGETCDDSGESPMCDDDCSAVSCGDGNVNEAAGETCDDSGETATCDDDCTAVSCGDGVTNEAAGETCDDSGESATCDDDCSAASCGDSTVNGTAGETCDDGGRSATCNADCTAASCGDGLLNVTAGEECDGDGAGTPGETATCDVDCTAAMCGDMVANGAAGESCDDGKESATCNADCTEAACGDNQVNATAGEECDDGNTEDGDGCSATCTDEAGTTGTETGTDSGDSSESGTGDSTDTMADTSGGMSATGNTSAPTTTDPDPTDTNGSEESESSGSGGASEDGGCACSTENDRGGAAWSMLGLLGLGAMMRRRRR